MLTQINLSPGDDLQTAVDRPHRVDFGWTSERLMHDATALSRATQASAWHQSGGRSFAPASWDGNLAAQLFADNQSEAANNWTYLTHGGAKFAFRTNISGAASVIVKRLSIGSTDPDAMWRELMYTEYLRGLPGIPSLLGAFFHSTHPDGDPKATLAEYFVFRDHGGETLGSGQGGAVSLGATYMELARERPLALTRAMLLCFQSFSESGGFFQLDFTPRQFVVAPSGADEVVFEVS